MKRRAFITLLGGAMGIVVVADLAASAAAFPAVASTATRR
jgi:hypothetical protein